MTVAPPPPPPPAPGLLALPLMTGGAGVKSMAGIQWQWLLQPMCFP